MLCCVGQFVTPVGDKLITHLALIHRLQRSNFTQRSAVYMYIFIRSSSNGFVCFVIWGVMETFIGISA